MTEKDARDAFGVQRILNETIGPVIDILAGGAAKPKLRLPDGPGQAVLTVTDQAKVGNLIRLFATMRPV